MNEANEIKKLMEAIDSTRIDESVVQDRVIAKLEELIHTVRGIEDNRVLMQVYAGLDDVEKNISDVRNREGI